MPNWTYLRGATVERVRMEDGKKLTMVFNNGAVLTIHTELEFTGGGYDFHDYWLDVQVEGPPQSEDSGWVVLKGKDNERERVHRVGKGSLWE